MTLYNGDCLQVAAENIRPESVDLVYLDPPFATGLDFGEFDDRWDNFEDYMVFMRERIEMCHGLLKETGSMYLHCNWKASHHLRLAMDAVFGERNFINEIIWVHTKIATATRKFINNHDSIFLYGKGPNYQFNGLKLDEPNTFYYKYKSRVKNNKLYYEDVKCLNDFKTKINVLRKELGREPVDADIVIDFNLRENRRSLDNIWYIRPINPHSTERTDYPTQKPLRLLRRFVEASSSEGDLILDPCCGSGSMLVAAKQMGRQFIGIDMNDYAIELASWRLDNDTFKKPHGILVQVGLWPDPKYT